MSQYGVCMCLCVCVCVCVCVFVCVESFNEKYFLKYNCTYVN